MLLTLKQDVPSYLRNKEELCSTSDVSIVLQDQSVLGAHRCFLSFASPVLREVMMSVDLRQEEEVFVLLEGFKKDTVVSFLQFIYNGFLVVNHKKESDLTRLFSTLRVNPGVERSILGKTDTKQNLNVLVSLGLPESIKPKKRFNQRSSKTQTVGAEVDSDNLKTSPSPSLIPSPSRVDNNCRIAWPYQTSEDRCHNNVCASSPNLINSSMDKSNKQSIDEKYKQASEAGWIREVIIGDTKGLNLDRIRVNYLPPKHTRHIKKRLDRKTKIQEFLTAHCSDTNLSLENFSFSRQVLGLDLPWEIVRPATISLELAQAQAQASNQLQQPETVAKGNCSKSVPPPCSSPPAEEMAVDLPRPGAVAVHHEDVGEDLYNVPVIDDVYHLNQGDLCTNSSDNTYPDETLSDILDLDDASSPTPCTNILSVKEFTSCDTTESESLIIDQDISLDARKIRSPTKRPVCYRLGWPDTSPLKYMFSSTLNNMSTPPLKNMSGTPLKDMSTYSPKNMSTPPMKNMSTPTLKDMSTPPRKDMSTAPLEDMSTSLMKNMSTPPLKNVSTPPLKNSSTPPLKNMSTPPLKNMSTHPLKDMPTPPLALKDLCTPALKDMSTLPLEDMSTPPLKEMSTSPLKDISTPILKDMSTFPQTEVSTPSPLKLTKSVTVELRKLVLQSTHSLCCPDMNSVTGGAVRQVGAEESDGSDDVCTTVDYDDDMDRVTAEHTVEVNSDREFWYNSRYRQPYSKGEEEAVVNYFLKNGGYTLKGGNTVWQQMEENWICPGRTWQSLRERFGKSIEKNLELFGVSEEQLKEVDRELQGLKKNETEGEDEEVLQRKGFRRIAHYYTRGEDLNILRFIAENERFEDVRGNQVWHVMEERKVVGGRSWQSMKERFKKVIMKRIMTYNLGEIEKRFRRKNKKRKV